MASVSPITSLEQFNSSLRSLNRILAQYKQLLRQVGSVTDCARVREQLQSLSVRLLASFAVSKDVILPAMRSHQATAGAAEANEADGESEAAATRKQWEARYTTFVQIVESTLDNLVRTAALIRRFPMHPDSLNRYVATGIAEFFNVERRSILSLSSSLRSSRRSSMSSGSRVSVPGGAASCGSGTPEGENSPGTVADSQHLMSLTAEIRATRELIEQLQSAVLIAHWTVQHKFDFEFSSTSGGASSGSSSGAATVAATAAAAAVAAVTAGSAAAASGANAGQLSRGVEALADPDGVENGEGQSSRRDDSDGDRVRGFAGLCLICK